MGVNKRMDAVDEQPLHCLDTCCYIHVQFRLCAWVLLTVLLRCMWFPFASLQVFFCNKFLKNFALTLAVTPGWPPSTVAFPSSRTTGEGCSPRVVPEPEVGTMARTHCLAPLGSQELCEVRRSLKGGSWNANMRLNNKMMSLAANPEQWCHMPGSPHSHSPHSPLVPFSAPGTAEEQTFWSSLFQS